MSTRSQLTKDLNESVKSLLGKNIKILLKCLVKLEKSDKKTENRVLVFSPCRLFFLTAKVPTRIDFHFHYLEIQAIESKKPNQLSFSVTGFEKPLVVSPHQQPPSPADGEAASHEVDGMLHTLASALRVIFPAAMLTHVVRRVELVPETRLARLLAATPPLPPSLSAAASGGVGPCGGFSTQYAAMCDFHGLPYREEVAWDVDTIYLSHDSKELCLRDFDHLDQKDLVPIVSALEHNAWFTSLRAGHVRLPGEALDRALLVVRRSLALEQLHLDNLGLRGDFAHKLSLSLLANPHSRLHTLDLSNNMIEDKGVGHLSHVIARLPGGLVRLSLSGCGLTCKGVTQLAGSLSANPCMASTLAHLDLSGNCLRDDLNNLCNFLAQPNCISHLDISGTDATLESLFGALLRGCTAHLATLNVSRNSFSSGSRKSKEPPPSFKQFFTSSLALRSLNVSSCRMPLEALKNLLLGLACNESAEGIILDLSSNGLGAAGAHVLESCIHGVRCLGHLDISDNNLDVELAGVVTAIGKNKGIQHLNMGRNLAGMKPKHAAQVMEALVQMIQEEDCVLQSLSLPDSKLKSELSCLINALGSNQCLHSIDISGNFMGDAGARLLAKALQINTKLKNLVFDRNNITLQGYSDIAYALESNHTLRYMPFPVFDVQPCMKASAERTDIIMRRIQELLHRNVTPKKHTQGQALRLQQGFLLGSTQHMVDRLVLQTQEYIQSCGQLTTEANNAINEAQGLIKDADNAKQLLPRLHEAVLGADCATTVEGALRRCASELQMVCCAHLVRTCDAMLTCATTECPHVMSDTRVHREVGRSCRERATLPPDLVQSAIVDQAGADILNKINELSLAAAAHLSDKVTDEVIESLTRCHKALIGEGGSRKRSSTPDVLRTRSRLSSDALKSEAGDDSSPSETASLTVPDQGPLATPHLSSKRRSLHGRKLRPKSVVDATDISADDIPDLLPPLRSVEESLDRVTELPPGGRQVLQHLAKGRPRRAKTRAPTRSMLRAPCTPNSENPEGEGDEDSDTLAAGLESFFVRPTTPLISPCDSSPLLGAPRSRSSDDLQRRTSPCNSLRNDRDLSASPLPRRPNTDLVDSTGTISASKGEDSDSPTSTLLGAVRLRTTGLLNNNGNSNGAEPVRPPSACSTTSVTAPRSPAPTKSPGGSRGKGDPRPVVTAKPPPLAPKPRPWSVAGSDRKSGEFGGGSDGSSTNTSAANTPDSGDALDESTDSGVASSQDSAERKHHPKEVEGANLEADLQQPPQPVPSLQQQQASAPQSLQQQQLPPLQKRTTMQQVESSIVFDFTQDSIDV